MCGEHSPCSGHTGFAPHRGVCAFPSTLLRLPAALYGAGPALSAVPIFGPSTKAWIRLRLRFVPSPALVVQAARGLAPSPRMWHAFSLRGPQRATGRVSGSLQTGTGGLFAGWEGVASLGLCLPLYPPPASFLQRGWAGSSLQFLSPFVLQTAGGVFWRVNFSLLSHSLKKLPPTALRGRSLP